MTIAILDDGICDAMISSDIYHIDLLKDGSEISHFSHGTVCAKIIEKYGDVDQLIDIRFLNVHRSGTIDGLIDALKCCLELRIDAINISCGIEIYMYNDPKVRKLHSLIKRLKNRGIEILAAQSNIGRIAIPAAFSEVVSVEHKSIISNRIHSIYRTSDIYLRAPHRVKLNRKNVITYGQNSYSCAYACALASRHALSFSKTKHNRYYIPTLTSKIRVPMVYIERGTASSETAETLKRKLEDEGYYVDIVSASPVDDIQGVRVFRPERLRFYFARYIKESRVDVVIFIGDRLPEIRFNTLQFYQAKTGRFALLAIKKSDSGMLSDVSRIIGELANA